MDEKLIRIRDFAESCGCTPQNIYLHLKNYATELEGHTIQGKGRQGILLDECAQDFLRSIMYPKELGENVVAQENERLRKALAIASQENAALLKRALAAEGELDRALLREGENQRLLAASEEAQEAQAEELRQAKVDMAAMTEMYKEMKQEADNAHLSLAKEKAAREAAENQNAALKSRGLIARILRRGE